jgi:hypothetical protein
VRRFVDGKRKDEYEKRDEDCGEIYAGQGNGQRTTGLSRVGSRCEEGLVDGEPDPPRAPEHPPEQEEVHGCL